MTSDLHTLVGAYALNALTPVEHEQFKQHLATCGACRTEFAELQATAARLSDVAWQSPPPEMKARLLDAIASTSQDRPPLAAPMRSSWSRMVPVLLAAAAVLALVGSIGAFVVERGRLVDVERQQSAVAAVLSAPDVKQRTARLDNGGSVRVLVSPSLDQAVVAMHDLPPLDADHTYQMWRIHRGGPESEAVFSGDNAAGSITRLVNGLGDTDAIAVTVEPAGGSLAPTTKPIVNIALA